MLYEESDDIDYDISSEPDAAPTINRELNLARRIVEDTAANLFLTGKAGTGKTTFLRNLRNHSRKQMIVLAPTGVAAINAQGVTLHSFFQLPFSPYIPGHGFAEKNERYHRFSKEKRRLISCLDLIVIDEISMVRPDTLDAIDGILKRLRGNQAPFGGVQLLLIGDLRQLAPVVRPGEWNELSKYYKSEYFFESKALQEAGFLTIELQTIYRQQDERFISLLNDVRDGKANMETLLSLNKRYVADADAEESSIILTTHNRISDQINIHHLAALDTPVQIFSAVVKGKFPESSYPADFTLNLKVGARVMFIKNDTGINRRYYNGLIGTVVEVGDDVVVVRTDDTDEEIDIGRVEWENTSYEIDNEAKEIRQVTDGTFSQIPLRLAWAITIHKSQGLTFDRAVIDASLSFAPGQLYVALSRCRSLQGLTLKSKLTPSAVIVDGNVNSFIETTRRESPDEDKFRLLRDEYFRRLLSELFNFNPLRYAYDDFSRVVKQYVAPIHPELFDSYRKADEIIASKVANVGAVFNSRYTSVRLDTDSTMDNEEFRNKIASGCRYFLEQLAPVCHLLNDTPCDLDNQTYIKQYNNAVEILRFEMAVKKYILKGILAEGFDIATYLRLKVAAQLDATAPVAKKKRSRGAEKSRKVAEVYAGEGLEKSPKKEKKEKKPKGYSQYITLDLYRQGMNMEQIATERGLSLSTIAGHLGEMVKRGEIELGDLLTPDQLQLIRDIESMLERENLEKTYTNLRDKLEPVIPKHLFSLYYTTIKP